ncbi:MAG: class F sortase [Actinomycetia bacterium]|nr:class F sortase [Actinomycetes bacterium]
MLALAAFVAALGLGVLAQRSTPPAPHVDEPFSVVASGASARTIPQAAAVPPAQPVQPVQAGPAAQPVPADVADPGGGPPSPETMAPGHLLIPSLGVYAPLGPARVVAGELVLPEDAAVPGIWLDGPALTSSAGSTLIAGHVSEHAAPGVFAELARIQPGDLIHTTSADGAAQTWRTTHLASVHKSALPPVVWAQDGPRRLVLVTCAGPVVRSGEGLAHRDNVVLVAIPVADPA